MGKEKRTRTTCVLCGKPLCKGRTKFCSYECYKESEAKKYREQNPLRGKTSGTTGAISELRVAVDLMTKGYNVFRALSPSCPCDLIILKDGIVIKIEVRTAHRSLLSGKLFNSKQKTDDGKSIDIYAFVCGDELVYDPPLESLSVDLASPPSTIKI